MDQILAKFALSLGFFTKVRLPEFLGSKISPDAKLKDAVVFFPIAGLLIGLVVATIWFASAQFLPPLVAAGLAILAGIVITGGLHEDGLADCADGLGGVVDKERALEIMRDSRIGTYGTLALITTTGLRWVSLAGLSIASGFSALIIAHTASRAAISMAMKYSDYARQSGLGDQVSGRISNTEFLLTTLIAAAAAYIFGEFLGLLALIAGFAVTTLFLRYLIHRLGGYTGDGLGAMQQLCEITILITLSGLWS